MTNSMRTRTLVGSLVAVLALAQAALGLVRALGFFEMGSDLMGRGVLLLPIIGVVVLVRGALIAGIALLYAFFAWGTLNGRPWVRTVGLIAAAVNLLLVVSVLIQGEPIIRVLLWCIVPIVVVCYLVAQPRASSA
jgi:hypothetical protein